MDRLKNIEYCTCSTAIPVYLKQYLCSIDRRTSPPKEQRRPNLSSGQESMDKKKGLVLVRVI